GALRIVPCFAFGCAIFLLWRAAPRLQRPAAAALAAVFMAAVAAAAASGAPDFATVALFGGLIFALAALSRSGSRLLSSPLGVYLGEVSFAVYMVCIPWRLVFAGLAHHALRADGPLPWPVWLAMIAGVLPVAMAAHHIVERPARAAMRAWGGFRF